MKKNKFIVLIGFIMCVNGLFSQSLSTKRMTLDYTFAMNYFFLQNETIKEHFASRFWDNRLNFNYKLGRKVSIELRSGTKKYQYSEFDIRKISYGVGFNFYFNSSYSPLGSSIGIFYEANNYMPTDYNTYYAFLSGGRVNNYETTTKINYKVDIIGVKFNYISMLSNEFPLYFKYGFNLAFPFQAQIYDESYKKGGFDRYDKEPGFGRLYDNNRIIRFKLKDTYRVNIGIGFMF